MRTKPRPCLLATLLLLAFAAPSWAADKINLLIVDGQNNHNWQAMTPPMKKVLEDTGRFAVDVVTSPPNKSPASDWEKFQPDFRKYAVVLSNYNGQPWPAKVQESFEKYVASGGGVAIIHAANNAFPGWGEYNKMIGLGWRGPEFGERLTLSDDGKQVRTPKGEGPGAGHGPTHEFLVIVRDREHPITKGMPSEWMHAKDELYHGQRGPAENMHVLATAFSAKTQRGTAAHEPMIWTIPYGKGRVFTTVLGHVMGKDTIAIQCVGFQTVMCRGCEWAGTGNVSQPLPANFPTAKEVRTVDLPK